MKNYLPGLFLIILLTGCFQESKQNLSYDEEETENFKNQELERPAISNLPVQIDSTEYILHPIGNFSINEPYSRWSEFGTSGSGSGNTSSSGSFTTDSYYGNLTNVKFQHISSDTLSDLTDMDIKISGITFLRELFNNLQKQFLLYRVNDKDSNNDRSIDQHDITTLYISGTNGTDFTKILPNDQELVDWRFISILNRLYFRSIEDTNRDGKFDKMDQFHYFYIDFNTGALKVVEHFPTS